MLLYHCHCAMIFNLITHISTYVRFYMKRSLDELFGEFLSELRFSQKLSAETLRGYEAGFRLFRTLLPVVTVDTLTKSALLAFFEKLDTRQRTVGKGELKSGVKRSTVATYRSKLNAFIKWMKNNGHIKENPFDGIKYPSVRYEDKAYLSGDETTKIFSALTMNDKEWSNSFIRRRNYAMFIVLLDCGLRKAELLGLKMLDVNFDRKEIRIDGETSKSKRDRVVPMNSEVYTVLKDYVQIRKSINPTTDYFFPADNGSDGLKHSGFKHIISKVRDLSGVKIHAHQFRHTFAVNLLNRQVDIAKLRQLLGHRDIRMTAAYVRCLPTDSLRGDIELICSNNIR